MTKNEIAGAFSGAMGEAYPPILSPKQLASLTGLSVRTIYEWLANDRLDGAFRRRGKHVLIWRDRALDILFNGAEWSHE